MPYPAGHRDEVRRRIVQSARRLFNQRGFENVSVNEIMAHADLTRGAFYSYFKSKSDLYSEVLQCFFTDPDWKNCWDGVNVDLGAADAGAQIIRAYLSRQHFDDIANSCPMVALPSDVARSGIEAKRAFETVFRAMVGVLEHGLRNGSQRKHITATALGALCVGGMVIARSIDDLSLADEVRDASMAVALSLGGWKSARKKRERTQSAAS